MKANILVDLAASCSHRFLHAAPGFVAVLMLLLTPFAVEHEMGFDLGSNVFAGNGSGGQPDTPGQGKGDLYSDLLVIYRSTEGLPYFVGVPEGEEEEEESVASKSNGVSKMVAALLADVYIECEQPITDSYIDDDPFIDDYAASALVLFDGNWLTNPLTNDADGKQASPVPLGGSGLAGEECDIWINGTDYVDEVQEVHFGRLNIGRAPIRVLSQQLRDVMGVLSGADKLGWDHGARITADNITVDSPLQNLAIHRELLIRGNLGPDVTLPNLPWTEFDILEYAAAALGAAADKGDYSVPGMITLDLVVFNNRILSIPDETSFFDVIEGDGEIGVNSRLYFDFSSFVYDRQAKYPGCAKGWDLSGDEPAFFNELIMDLVFAGQEFVSANVFGFATAADDSRRVITFAHDTEAHLVIDIDSAGESSICEQSEP